MALPPGERLAAYEIVAPLGTGAMGEVYRARDTALGRDVALKLLPEALASDDERLARFHREARMLAQLNHPGIAQVHGIEKSDTGRFIVMELVPGGTLTGRLASGPIQWREALELARQMADALEAAHESGVVHRDLKPDNVGVTPDDVVKLLDFGIGKPVGEEAERVIGTSSGMTQPGAVLGTPAYISPEQMRGKPVDRRADIWAFGCLLFEMLAGSKAFPGETMGEIAAAVLKGEPDWAALPAETPERLRRLIERCLEREPRSRLRDMGEARLSIERMLAGEPDLPRVPPVEQDAARRRSAWPVVAVVAVLLAFLLGRMGGSPESEPERSAGRTLQGRGETRFEIPVPEGQELLRVAVSPDGSALAFVLLDLDTMETAVWLRRLDEPTLVRLDETVGVTRNGLSFAPDASAIAFVEGGALRRLDLDTGTVKKLCHVAWPLGPSTWSRRGEILFRDGMNDGLSKISATGGAVKVASRPDEEAGERGHMGPTWTEDGSAFFARVTYTTSGDEDAVSRAPNVVFFGPRYPTDPSNVVCSGDSNGWPVGDWLIYRERTKLLALPFDPNSGAARGEPRIVADGVDPGALPAGASLNAVVAFQAGWHRQGTRLVWRDLAGKAAGSPAEPDWYWSLHPSPSGDRIVAARQDQADISEDIWILNPEGRPVSRLTTGEDAVCPVWSPDGSRIAYHARDGGARRVCVRAADGAGDRREIDTGHYVYDWSADGWLCYSLPGKEGYLRFRWIGDGSEGDLADPQRPKDRELRERGVRCARFSPDGRWIVYQAGDPGSPAVYVRRFVEGFDSDRALVSGGEGQYPDWSPVASEVVFIRDRTSAMRVRLQPAGPDGTELRPDAAGPTRLFTARQETWLTAFMYSHDGQRILCNELPPPNRTPITVIVDWQPPTR